MLPPDFCWSEAGKIEIDPDGHVQEAIRMVFAKFRELGTPRHAFESRAARPRCRVRLSSYSDIVPSGRAAGGR
jgi:hypothetical protein